MILQCIFSMVTSNNLFEMLLFCVSVKFELAIPFSLLHVSARITFFKLSSFLSLSSSTSQASYRSRLRFSYTVGTESIQTPLHFSLFVILQPFAKII